MYKLFPIEGDNPDLINAGIYLPFVCKYNQVKLSGVFRMPSNSFSSYYYFLKEKWVECVIISLTHVSKTDDYFDSRGLIFFQ